MAPFLFLLFATAQFALSNMEEIDNTAKNRRTEL